MNLNEKLETLNKQSEELRIMYLKVQGAIELTNAMIEEEKKGKKEEPKTEDKKEK